MSSIFNKVANPMWLRGITEFIQGLWFQVGWIIGIIQRYERNAARSYTKRKGVFEDGRIGQVIGLSRHHTLSTDLNTGSAEN